jgi:hypothetical protein
MGKFIKTRTLVKIQDIAKYASRGDKAANAGDAYSTETYEGLIMLAAMDELEIQGYKLISPKKEGE